MKKEAIQHIGDSTYAYPLDRNTIRIKLRTAKKDVDKALLCYGYRYEQSKAVTMTELEMSVTYSDELYDYYETNITPGYVTICYYFKIINGHEEVIYAQERFFNSPPDCRNEYFMFPYISRGDLYQCGSWWEDSIFYQIFVDRFNKEDIDDNWYRTPSGTDIYGGNIRGIQDKLDYLIDLGINCIYLTPIFESESNHKYDTIDYYKIDRNFGDENIFKEFVEACHNKGIRVILDAVFNHTSDNFYAFRDYKHNGEKSKYKYWYYTDEKGKFETFGEVASMPKLNTTNPEVIDYLLDISTHWIKNYNIDGWRLDVANEIDHSFWRKFREAVKCEKADAFIIGEAWDGGESFLYGDQFDSDMNYPFMHIMLDYFAKESIDIKRFDSLINNLFVRYKLPIRKQLLNLLNSHDTSRFLYECNEKIESLKMAVFFMFTCIGIPMIFYGDEIGLSGANDPDCRKAMRYDDYDKDLYNFYKKLIAIRKAVRPLRNGEYKTLYADSDVYAFTRYDNEQQAIVVFNYSGEEKNIELTINASEVNDVFNNKRISIKDNKLNLCVKPYGKHIFY